jgi:transcriptional regulator with XRE-family HTH domain
MDDRSIKQNIHNFRKKRKYTQGDVANMLGISVTAYRELERGETSIVNPNIVRMADLMNTTTEELVLGYLPAESEDNRLEEVQIQFGNKVENLENKVRNLEKLVSSLEETVASKNEIISMLKNMLAEQK